MARCGPGGSTARACNTRSPRERALPPCRALSPRHGARPPVREIPDRQSRHPGTPPPRRPSDWDESVRARARPETTPDPYSQTRSPLLLEQPVDVLVGRKPREIVDPLANSHVPDRQLQVVGDCDGDAAF